MSRALDVVTLTGEEYDDLMICLSCGHSIDAHDRQYGCAEDGCDCETPNASNEGPARSRRRSVRTVRGWIGSSGNTQDGGLVS